MVSTLNIAPFLDPRKPSNESIDPGLSFPSMGRFTAEAIDIDLKRPAVLIPFKPMVVAKVKGIIRHADYPDEDSQRFLPEDNAVEDLTTLERPGNAHDVEKVEHFEHKDMEPYRPEESNAGLLPNNDDEPEGSTAPDDRRRNVAAVPGIVSRPCGGDEWLGVEPKAEGAVEGGKPPKPREPLEHDTKVDKEEKADSMGPKDPPAENTWYGGNHDDEPEGSVAPPGRKRAATSGVISASFEAPIVADPIGGPVLQLSPASFEPGSPPELPKPQPKIPPPSNGPVITRSNQPCAPNGFNHRAVDPIIDFIGEEKGHQDGELAVPGILQALKLLNELFVTYGGLEVPRPQQPENPPGPEARAVLAF